MCNRNRKKTKKVKCLSKYYLFIPSVKCYYTFVRKKDKKITKIPFWPKSPLHKRKAGFLKRLVRCESILLIYYPPKHLVTSLEEHPAVYPAAGCFSFSIPFQFAEARFSMSEQLVNICLLFPYWIAIFGQKIYNSTR